MTPNQKATAWLLFHDQVKDPRESLWRWVLASMYYQLQGPHWKNSQTNSPFPADNGWFSATTSVCAWDRVITSTRGCDGSSDHHPLPIIELDFHALNLIGTIPIELALLGDSGSSSTLRSIALSKNQLSGTVPGAIFQPLLPTLGTLYLNNNKLVGTIPTELGGLDTLYLQHNAFTGDWPVSFCPTETDASDDSRSGIDDDDDDDDNTVWASSSRSSNSTIITNFGVDCDTVECLCCGSMHCYYSNSN